MTDETKREAFFSFFFKKMVCSSSEFGKKKDFTEEGSGKTWRRKRI